LSNMVKIGRYTQYSNKVQDWPDRFTSNIVKAAKSVLLVYFEKN